MLHKLETFDNKIVFTTSNHSHSVFVFRLPTTFFCKFEIITEGLL